MKKKLEAELISIAHRILKLKNRAELDQLQAETLKLYEKLSVLRFVEDNFADAKPTIGYASAEGKLEEVYGMEELPHVHANEVEAAEAKAREEKKNHPAPEAGEQAEKPSDEKQDKENESSEGRSPQTPEGGDAQETEENPKEKTDDNVKEETPETKQEENKEEEAPEPEHEVEVVKPEAEVTAMEEGAIAVFEKEDNSTEKEEEEAADAEVITITPDASAKTEEAKANVEFAFERKPAPEEPQKQKEITFEDYHDYKEPEFVKKGDEKKEEPKPVAEEPKKEEPKADETTDDWRNWEPSKPAEEEKPKQEEPKQPEPVAEVKPVEDWRTWEPKKDLQPETPAPTPAAVPVAPRPVNDAFGKTINLALNDRIAFEKNLFGGSSEDLNRVVSQINTQNSFDEAKAFIEDLVKPDYNNWSGKEEYEARFMELVEKRFS